MQKKAPGRRPAVASFLIVLWFATPGIAAPESRLELRGEIVLPPTEEGGAEQAIVFLTGATDPFSAQTRSNPRGCFRFPKLEPGTYNLSILIPGKRERRQTVEVTPSLADARGVVTVTVTLDLTDEDSRRRAPPGRSVSVRELSIPRSARREFARAENALGKRNTEEALRHLEKAVSIAPQFVRALNKLGTVHYQTQSYEKAEHYFRQALKHDPEAFAPLVNLGGTLYSMQRYTEAVALNRQAVVGPARRCAGQRATGNVLSRSGKLRGCAHIPLEGQDDLPRPFHPSPAIPGGYLPASGGDVRRPPGTGRFPRPPSRLPAGPQCPPTTSALGNQVIPSTLATLLQPGTSLHHLHNALGEIFPKGGLVQSLQNGPL